MATPPACERAYRLTGGGFPPKTSSLFATPPEHPDRRYGYGRAQQPLRALISPTQDALDQPTAPRWVVSGGVEDYPASGGNNVVPLSAMHPLFSDHVDRGLQDGAALRERDRWGSLRCTRDEIEPEPEGVGGDAAEIGGLTRRKGCRAMEKVKAAGMRARPNQPKIREEWRSAPSGRTNQPCQW